MTPDFQLLFESAPGLFLALDPDLTIVAASNAYLTATMTTREEIVGQALFEVFPGNAGLRRSLDHVRTRGVSDAMPLHKYHRGRPAADGGGCEAPYWNSVNMPVFVGGAIRYILHHVEDAAQSKTLVTSLMSHELRTPLNSILGFAQLMTMDHELAPEHQQGARQILKSGGVLLQMIDAVLGTARATGEVTAAPPDAAPSGAAGTVLYIEDNRSNVHLLARVMQHRPGVAIIHADTGASGVEMARARRPDLVLLDLHLPDMPGEDVLRQLSQDLETRVIPVIVITADATPGLPLRLKADAAAACVTKPIDVGRVLALVDRYLQPQANAS